MSAPTNPHDKLFKATFLEKDLVINYICNFLPEHIEDKIDRDSLELEPISYLNPSLAEFYSDVVYSCRFGETEIQVALLFEHKSYVPDYPHFQLLRYIVEAWFQMIAQKKTPKPIIPIIIYHGDKKWHYKPLEFYFDKIDASLVPFLPSFSYLLTDLSGLSDEMLTNMPIGILEQAFLLLKHTRKHPHIDQFFLKLFSSLESYSQINQYPNLIVSFIVYIWSVSGLKKERFVKFIRELPPSINNQVMTTYEQIIQEGIQEGQEQAKKAYQNHVIKQGIKSGLEIELIARLADLSLQEVRSRIKELGMEK